MRYFAVVAFAADADDDDDDDDVHHDIMTVIAAVTTKLMTISTLLFDEHYCAFSACRAFHTAYTLQRTSATLT
jgi:hypothetical protein